VSAVWSRARHALLSIRGWLLECSSTLLVGSGADATVRFRPSAPPLAAGGAASARGLFTCNHDVREELKLVYSLQEQEESSDAQALSRGALVRIRG